MLQKSRELLFALVAIIFITILYLFVMVIYRDVPTASGLYGHGMGILGFLLMLMTETLYTLRKRLHSARLGNMAGWLEFHIFTGLVGPYMVLLHSSWKFNGLAGVLSLLTLMIVVSGFVGRYIYTAVPRTADGTILTMHEIEREIQGIEAAMRKVDPQQTQPSRSILPDKKRNRSVQPEKSRLKGLQRQKDRLHRQVASLVTARRMLAIWHTVHIPLGLTLFVMAFVHIGAAIYYAALLR